MSMSCRSSSIGVGKGLALPALRTVRAVLPHPALQSGVSSSGVFRLREGCVKGEQSLGREERVGPALMIGFASSDAGALFPLAQEGAQPSADKAVDDAEQGWRGMFEVAKPSPEHRVEVGDDPFEAVPRLRLVRLRTLSFSACRLCLRTSRRPASNR